MRKTLNDLLKKGWTVETNPWFIARRFGSRQFGSSNRITIAFVQPLTEDQLAFLSTWTDSIQIWLSRWEQLPNRPPIGPSLSGVRLPQSFGAHSLQWLRNSPVVGLLPLYSLMWGGSRRLLLVAACRNVPGILELSDDRLRVLFAELMNKANSDSIDILAWLRDYVTNLQ